MSTSALTSEDYETLRQLAERGASHFAYHGRPTDPEPPKLTDSPRRHGVGEWHVSRQLCERWRRLDKSTPIDDIADTFGVSKGSVSYHLNDRCDHDTALSVTPERCAVIRCMAEEGHAFAYIARLFSSLGSRRTVSRHARGICSHDIDIPPVAPRQGVAD